MHHCDITKTITITKESSSLSLSLYFSSLLSLNICCCFFLFVAANGSFPSLHPPFLVFFFLLRYWKERTTKDANETVSPTLWSLFSSAHVSLVRNLSLEGLRVQLNKARKCKSFFFPSKDMIDIMFPFSPANLCWDVFCPRVELIGKRRYFCVEGKWWFPLYVLSERDKQRNSNERATKNAPFSFCRDLKTCLAFSFSFLFLLGCTQQSAAILIGKIFPSPLKCLAHYFYLLLLLLLSVCDPAFYLRRIIL